jgi:hypothetical protein
MENPFNYLQFATGDQFYDRREIRKDLLSRFLSGQSNVVLYGPRRYGKSSLVAELVGDLEKAGVPCVTIDVVKVPSIDMFVSAYATKVYRRLAPVAFEFKKLLAFLKSLRPRLTLDQTGEAGLSFDPSDSPIGAEALTEVLDLPQKLLSGKGRAVVVFDEFQEVKDLLPNDGFERIMRSAIQSHRNVSYVFLGSRYHMLRRMFSDHNRPFYKSAVMMLLDKPPVEDSIRFVVDRFASAGKSIGREAAEHLVAKIENIPYFIQQLGFETFRIVDDSRRKSVSPADVDAAYAHLSGFNRDQYEQLMLTLSASQKKLMIAIARERTKEFDDDFRKRHSLGVSSTVNSAKVKLMEDGHIELSNGQYVVADPFFAQYLRTV